LDKFNGTVAELRAKYKPVPPDDDEGDMPEIDKRIKPFLTMELTGAKYKLEKVEWFPSDPPVFYVEVLDENNKRLTGVRVTQTWNGGNASGIMEAKSGDPGGVNFLMNQPLGSYGVFVGERAESDYLFGMGLGLPETPTVKTHTHFVITFRRGARPEPTRYTITTSVVGNGTVQLTPAGGTYDAGTTISVAAPPAAGWKFAGWSGSITGSTNPATITVNANLAITATFEQEPVPPDDDTKAQLLQKLGELEQLYPQLEQKLIEIRALIEALP